MRVDGLCIGTQVFHAKMPDRTESKIGEKPHVLRDSTVVDEPWQIAPQQEAAAGNTEETKGVLRLLQEGHFKGVSDVRLRINFFDELVAIEREELHAIAEEKVGAVGESARPAIEALLQLSEPEQQLTEEQKAEIREAHDNFVQVVNNLKEDFLSAEAMSIGSLINALHLGFEDLVQSLQTVLGIDTVNPGDSDDVSTEWSGSISESADPGEPDKPDDETGVYTQFFDDLASAFNSALEVLDSALGDVEILPELSTPSGRGVAYYKFLAIYNEMRGIETPKE
jgi:hypothetical protein